MTRGVSPILHSYFAGALEYSKWTEGRIDHLDMLSHLPTVARLQVGSPCCTLSCLFCHSLEHRVFLPLRMAHEVFIR